jgi:hypothetical protein
MKKRKRIERKSNWTNKLAIWEGKEEKGGKKEKKEKKGKKEKRKERESNWTNKLAILFRDRH